MLPSLLAAQLQDNDMVITQGAGSIGAFARDFSTHSLLQTEQVEK
jgi:UDP-N-acetylmuramate--alanine ligase